MQYPVLTSNPSLFIPNTSTFTIVPVTNPNMLIDGFPVITSFAWTNNESGSSGTVVGTSLHTIDNLPLLLYDATVTPYYTMSGVAQVLSD